MLMLGTSLKAFDAKLCKRDGCKRGRIVGNKCRGRPCSAATVDHHSIFERSLAASIQTAPIAGAQEQGTVGLCIVQTPQTIKYSSNVITKISAGACSMQSDSARSAMAPVHLQLTVSSFGQS